MKIRFILVGFLTVYLAYWVGIGMMNSTGQNTETEVSKVNGDDVEKSVAEKKKLVLDPLKKNMTQQMVKNNGSVSVSPSLNVTKNSGHEMSLVEKMQQQSQNGIVLNRAAQLKQEQKLRANNGLPNNQINSVKKEEADKKKAKTNS